MEIKKLAIVGAMDSEILYLKEKMEENKKIVVKEVNGFIFYEGKLFDKDIILVKSGVGRVASAILFTTLCMKYSDIDLVINVGIAGGYAGTKVGDIVAKRALEKGIKAVVFDRGGYIYHGKVKALADAAREAGLEF